MHVGMPPAELSLLLLFLAFPSSVLWVFTRARMYEQQIAGPLNRVFSHGDVSSTFPLYYFLCFFVYIYA